MSLVVVVLLAALAMGRLLGGSLERLGSLGVVRVRLLVAALVVQAAGALVGGPVHPVGLAVSAALVLAFLGANRGVRGTGLVALGLAANALVVGLNGAMPVSPAAAARIGADPLALLDARHELSTSRTRLAVLGDVVPVPLPLRPEVVSPGDVLVAAGLGQLLLLGMTGGARGAAPWPTPPARRVVTPGPAPATARSPRPSRR